MARSKSKGKVVTISVIASVIIGIILAILASLGMVSFGVAALIFGALCIGMVAIHGGSMELISNISDHEGYEQQVEDDEKWKEESVMYGEGEEERHEEDEY